MLYVREFTSSFFIFLSIAKRSTTSTLIATVLKLFWAALSQSEKVLKTHCASSMQDTSSWRCLIVSCNIKEDEKNNVSGEERVA